MMFLPFIMGFSSVGTNTVRVNWLMLVTGGNVRLEILAGGNVRLGLLLESHAANNMATISTNRKVKGFISEGFDTNLILLNYLLMTLWFKILAESIRNDPCLQFYPRT